MTRFRERTTLPSRVRNASPNDSAGHRSTPSCRCCARRRRTCDPATTSLRASERESCETTARVGASNHCAGVWCRPGRRTRGLATSASTQGRKPLTRSPRSGPRSANGAAWYPSTLSTSGPAKGAGRGRPGLIERPDGALFALAGLWERWQGSERETALTGELAALSPGDAVENVHGTHHRRTPDAGFPAPPNARHRRAGRFRSVARGRQCGARSGRGTHRTPGRHLGKQRTQRRSALRGVAHGRCFGRVGIARLPAKPKH